MWFYQIQGFELGPVPPTEMSRLILKGRINPDTLVRRESGEWLRAGTMTSLYPRAPESAEPWYLLLFGRFAAFGIPMGVALLPWGRVAAFAGFLLLSPFLVALIRLLRDISRDVKAIRRRLASE